MRLTIERMRTLVLVAGGMLVVALIAFLVVGRLRSRFNLREIPKRLGVNIQQEANGVTYTQARGGHTLFKIHASKVVQLKLGGKALLHDVQIELYGEDGSRVDRIAGDEFEYDQKEGKAIAAGPVEITLTKPSESPILGSKGVTNRPAKATPLANVEHSASQGQIHVKTSGLTFDQQTGVATTEKRVEFAITQGNGSSVGARFDSQNGQLVLDHAVELNVKRGTEAVVLHAQHAEFSRGDLLCRLAVATASFRGGEAQAGSANLVFRPDGSAISLDATNGFSLVTKTQARIAAPRGTLEFDEHNQPRKGRLEGGATMDSTGEGRMVHAASPTADLQFTGQGELRRAHLERGVTMHSEESAAPAGKAGSTRTVRDWRSPIADVEFRNSGKGQVELASVNGKGGVTITGITQRGNGPVQESRMSADEVTGVFAAHGSLSGIVGTGHAGLEQKTASGARQTVSGNRVEANFTAAPPRPASARTQTPAGVAMGGSAAAIQTATVEGNVLLVQEPADRPGTENSAKLRATADKATYEGAGEWLHLTGSPRVQDGGLQLTADKVDVAQSSGDAFAHGNVKATWTGSPNGVATGNAGKTNGPALIGQGPTHVIATDAQLQQSTGQATFRGQARLWQGADSISAPVIVLDRTRQTLVAHAGSASDPVKVVFESAGNPASLANGKQKSPSSAPSVVRVRGGDLKYSGAERKAVIRSGSSVSVVAETADATITSSDVELTLLPPGNHAREDGGAGQVDCVTANGHVSVRSAGRQGTGERLVYSADTGLYVLSGTTAEPPRMIAPGRGVITGESLIFNSRDDSVSIEGGGRKTTTETIAPK